MGGSGFFDTAAADQTERAIPRSSPSKSALPFGLVWSREVLVMLRPMEAYRWLARLPTDESKWKALRRPLYFAFLLGCMVSLVTSQRLTLRLVAGGASSASIVVLAQIGALAVICRRARMLSISRAINLFFMGYGPWTLWILCFSAVWAFGSPLAAFSLAGSRTILQTVSLVALWSAYIDYCFVRCVLQRNPMDAARDLLLQRAISWSLAMVIFGGGPLWSEHMKMFAK